MHRWTLHAGMTCLATDIVRKKARAGDLMFRPSGRYGTFSRTSPDATMIAIEVSIPLGS